MEGLRAYINRIPDRLRELRVFSPRRVSAVERDWLMVLAAFALAVLAVLALSVYFFVRVNRSDAPVPTAAAPQSAQTIKRAELERVLKRFEARARSFEALGEEPPALADPAR